MKYGWYWNGKEDVQGWYEDQNEKELDISGRLTVLIISTATAFKER